MKHIIIILALFVSVAASGKETFHPLRISLKPQQLDLSKSTSNFFLDSIVGNQQVDICFWLKTTKESLPCLTVRSQEKDNTDLIRSLQNNGVLKKLNNIYSLPEENYILQNDPDALFIRPTDLPISLPPSATLPDATLFSLDIPLMPRNQLVKEQPKKSGSAAIKNLPHLIHEILTAACGIKSEYCQDLKATIADLNQTRQLTIRYTLSSKAEADKVSTFLSQKNSLIPLKLALKKSIQSGLIQTSHSQLKSSLSLSLTWQRNNNSLVTKTILENLIAIGLVNEFRKSQETYYKTIHTPKEYFTPKTTAREISNRLNKELPRLLFIAGCSSGFVHVDFEAPLTPNAYLSDISYEILDVRSGKNRPLLDKKKTQKQKINLGLNQQEKIFIPIIPKTKKKDISKATIRFSGLVADKTKRLTLQRSDLGKLRKIASLGFTLNKMDLNKFQLSHNGQTRFFIHASDKDGKNLKVDTLNALPKSITGKFHGEIHTLEITAVLSSKKFEREFSFNLNKGQPRELPSKPVSWIPRRREKKEPKIYDNITEQQFKKLKIEWQEVNDSKDFNQRLSIALPEKKHHISAKIILTQFSKKNVLTAKGRLFFKNQNLIHYLNKETCLAYGNLLLSARSGLQKVTFEKGNNYGVKGLVDSQPIKLLFRHNWLTLETPLNSPIKIHSLRAYDKFGVDLLMADQESQKGKTYKQETYKYFGIPEKIVIQASTRNLERKIEFNHKIAPYDASALRVYQERLLQQEEIASALKVIKSGLYEIDRYSDDLAALYYALKGDQKREIIAQEIAHANPEGAERFSYIPKVYNGYYFQFAKGINKNGKHIPFKKTKAPWQIKTSAGLFDFMRSDRIEIVAYPQDKLLPTFITSQSYIYAKHLNDEHIEFIPKDPAQRGWNRVKKRAYKKTSNL